MVESLRSNSALTEWNVATRPLRQMSPFIRSLDSFPKPFKVKISRQAEYALVTHQFAEDPLGDPVDNKADGGWQPLRVGELCKAGIEPA